MWSDRQTGGHACSTLMLSPTYNGTSGDTPCEVFHINPSATYSDHSRRSYGIGGCYN